MPAFEARGSLAEPQPDGKTETFRELPVDRYVTIVEGVGVRETI